MPSGHRVYNSLRYKELERIGTREAGLRKVQKVAVDVGCRGIARRRGLTGGVFTGTFRP